jgi:hypothetical protein
MIVLGIADIPHPETKCKECGHEYREHHIPPLSCTNDPYSFGYPAHIIEACSRSMGWSGSELVLV